MKKMYTTQKFGSLGFTLVELMIVVSVITLLATFALEVFDVGRINLKSKNSRILNDFRTHSEAFVRNALENGDYAPDSRNASVPSGMNEYLSSSWLNSTVGGQWIWDHNNLGFTAGVSLSNAKVGTLQMSILDQQLDDGDLASGAFRKTSPDRYTLVIEE